MKCSICGNPIDGTLERWTCISTDVIDANGRHTTAHFWCHYPHGLAPGVPKIPLKRTYYHQVTYADPRRAVFFRPIDLIEEGGDTHE